MKIKFEADNMQFELDIKPSADAKVLAVEPSDHLTYEIDRLETELATTKYEYDLALQKISRLESDIGFLDEYNEGRNKYIAQLEIDIKAGLEREEKMFQVDNEYKIDLLAKIEKLEADNVSLNLQIDKDNKVFESGFQDGYESAIQRYKIDVSPYYGQSFDNATKTYHTINPKGPNEI